MKKYEIDINGQVYHVTLREISEAEAPVQPKIVEKSSTVTNVQQDSVPVHAPMAGNVLSVKVHVGDMVQKGDTLLILEAMKMENEILAPADGKVTSIEVSENQGVESSQLLLLI